MRDPRASDIILIPVHNRRATTLAALTHLEHDKVPDWARVLVIDDGSTDGTATAIRHHFPWVEILSGDGTWWWCGAIRRGMERALADGAHRVYWLNDDCTPPQNGLSRLRALSETDNCVAWIDAISPSGWSYGAHRRTAWRLRRCTPQEEATGLIDSFSGNCVVLPSRWIERVGLPHDHLFPHGIGDLDYGLRLKAAGAKMLPLANAVATNGDPSRASSESWLSSDRPMRAIWQDFRSPRSFLYFPAWRRFALRHWGPFWGWPVFLAPYARWGLIAIIRAVAPSWAKQRRTEQHARKEPN